MDLADERQKPPPYPGLWGKSPLGISEEYFLATPLSFRWGTWHMPDCSSSLDTATCIGIAVFRPFRATTTGLVALPPLQGQLHTQECFKFLTRPLPNARLIFAALKAIASCLAVPRFLRIHKRMPGSSSFLRATVTGLAGVQGHKPGCSPHFHSQMDGRSPNIDNIPSDDPVCRVALSQPYRHAGGFLFTVWANATYMASIQPF